MIIRLYPNPGDLYAHHAALHMILGVEHVLGNADHLTSGVVRTHVREGGALIHLKNVHTQCTFEVR